MKYCDKCKKSFPDNQLFCSECGNKLSDYATNSNEVNTNNTSNRTGSSKGNTGIWLPVIIAGVGALIGLFLSGLLGLVCGVAGIGLVLQGKKQGQYEQGPFVLTWILAIIDVIFWLMTTTA